MSRTPLGSRCSFPEISLPERPHRSSDRRVLATIGLLSAALMIACANVGAQTLPGKPEPMPRVSPPSGDSPSSRAGTRESDRHSAATIRRLQHSLMQGGYNIDAADGVWGPRTAAAVREFQRVKGLPVTGRADSQTLAALGVSADGAAGGMPAPPVRQWTPRDLGRASSGQWARDHVGVHTLFDGDDTFGRHERRRMMRAQIVQRAAILAPELQQVGSAGRCAQHNAGAGTLEQHVGDDRRPMDDRRDRRVVSR